MQILLGISAGIASYKIPLLVRLLIQQGHEVKVIMTPDSVDFVSPLVLSTLSKNEVCIEFWDKKTGKWKNHVEFAEWADLMLLAPCTANTLAKMAQGTCDNLLLATYFSMRKQTFIAPAMDLEMYQHPSVKRNLEILVRDGVTVIPPDYGELASGLVGEGRMPEPAALAQVILQSNDKMLRLNGVKALVTAGPTFEPIDAVRFIGNRSSGKMGYAVALALAQEGAHVTLISGPTQLHLQHPLVELVPINTALELFEQIKVRWSSMDLGVFAAAVADYRPAVVVSEKIKKKEDSMEIELKKTEDSLAWAGKHKSDHQYLVGFALETNNGEAYAREKLRNKNLSAVILNVLGETGVGFNEDTNKIRIFDHAGQDLSFPLASKKSLAKQIVDYIINNR